MSFLLGLSGCANGIKGGDYLNREPAFVIEQFFKGDIKAWGIIQDRRGKVITRFEADIIGSWEGNTGTLDEDRWWDADEYAQGNIVQLSKEFVRQHYVGTGHQEELRLAREGGKEDPPIPALPQEVIDDTAALYASMYERLTGLDF